ncbi:MAG TPA: hypothetical protein VJ826_09935 [Candidatus Polarisedimenticolaceae bacterium]|nr:hypothetical protein [Candidatus Polarisedimenticolaceae bacterium]
MRFRSVALATMVAASLLGCGGGNDSGGFAVTFTPSTTATAPRLVKLVQKSKSGGRVVVQVVIYGPDASLDMFSFAFDVLIGDPNVLRFVSGSDHPGNALVPSPGTSQTVDSIAGLGTLPAGGTDFGTVVVGVTKFGDGSGNGISGSSAVVVELAFDVRSAGTTTLTLAGSGGNAARVFDSNLNVIGTITFDSESASVQGTSAGGGGGY